MGTERWPSIDEIVERARKGIIDESYMAVRPDPEMREAIRADLEQFHAKRGATTTRLARAPRRRKPA